VPTSPWLIAAAILFALWVLAHFKTSRPDGVLIGKIHPYRRIMPFIMKSRNESVVYFDEYVRAEPLVEYMDAAKAEFDANMTHAIVATLNIALAQHTRLNRFVVGKRMYARNGRWFTFAAKRSKGNETSKLGVVKLEMQEGETFRGLVGRINGKIGKERSGEKTGLDIELKILLLIPRFILATAVRLFEHLDYLNLIPGAFIRGDGMYTSIFIANLGSVNLAPGFHHLYEWGTCPVFLMMGKIEDQPCVGADGELEVGKVLHIRISYDERVDDGMTAGAGMRTIQQILAEPRKWLGGLEADGTVDVPMWPRAD